MTKTLAEIAIDHLWRTEEDRERFKLERDDLLAVLFQPYETRKHLAEAILAGDPDAKQIPRPRQTGPSQSG